MDFKRVADFLHGRSKAEPECPPDPALDFPNPRNESLLTRLKEDAKVDPATGNYALRAHPDLVDILDDLVKETGAKRAYVYGRPVLANSDGVIFAYAGGTHYIFFRLREDRIALSERDGGRFDPTYGNDWIEFRVGGRIGSRLDWREAMRRWAKTSYQDSLRSRD